MGDACIERRMGRIGSLMSILGGEVNGKLMVGVGSASRGE